MRGKRELAEYRRYRRSQVLLEDVEKIYSAFYTISKTKLCFERLGGLLRAAAIQAPVCDWSPSSDEWGRIMLKCE